MPVMGVSVALKFVEHACVSVCRSGRESVSAFLPAVWGVEVDCEPEAPGLLPLAW